MFSATLFTVQILGEAYVSSKREVDRENAVDIHCPVFLSVAVINTVTQGSLVRTGFVQLAGIIGASQAGNSRLGALRASLAQPVFFHSPSPPALGQHCLQWPRPSSTN